MEVLIIKGINALFQRRFFIMAMTVLLGLVGAVRGCVYTSYEAQTNLMLTPLGVTGESAKAVAAIYPAKVFSGLLLSPQVVGSTIKKLVESGAMTAQDAPDVDTLTDKLQVTVETVDATTRPITYSPLVRLRAVAKTPELATAIVKTWAAVADVEANRMLALPLLAASKSLGEQKSLSKSKVDEIWKELSLEKSQYDIELMRAQAELQLKQIDLLQSEQEKVQRELDGFQKGLEAVQKSLAEMKPYHELARAPDDAAFWIVQAQGGGEKSMKDFGSKVMVTQEVNQVYWDTKTKEGQFQSDIAANQAKLTTLNASIEGARAENKALQSAIGEHTVKQRELESRETVAKLVFEDVAKATATNEVTLGMIQVSADLGLRPVGLNSLSEDIYPIKSVSLLSGKRAALLGVVLGFLLSACFVLLREVGIPWWRWALDKYGAAS